MRAKERNTFAGLSDVFAYLDSRPRYKSAGKESQTLGTEGGFYQFESLDAARSAALFGWPEGVAMLKAAAEHLPAEVRASADAFRAAHHVGVEYAVAGSFPDVARFVSGEPESMQEFVTSEHRQRVKMILVEVGTPGDVSAQDVAERGAIALATIEALESAGIQCHVAIGNAAKNSENTSRFEAIVTVKEAGEPLDLHRLAFALVAADMHRRLMFGCRERSRSGYVMTKDGYGRTHHVGMQAAAYPDVFRTYTADDRTRGVSLDEWKRYTIGTARKILGASAAE